MSDFMKNYAKFKSGKDGQSLNSVIKKLHMVIVLIFDGVDAMDPMIRDWLEQEIPGSTCRNESSGRNHSSDSTIVMENQDFDSHDVESNDEMQKEWQVIATMTKWKYRSKAINNEGKEFLDYSLITIVKRKNYRKHNSHHWFFAGICEQLSYESDEGAASAASINPIALTSAFHNPQTTGLESSGYIPNGGHDGDSVISRNIVYNDPLVFLTDCGTRFNTSCLCTLVIELLSRKDLVGVTGRQRVDEPNETFHACQENTYCCIGKPWNSSLNRGSNC